MEEILKNDYVFTLWLLFLTAILLGLAFLVGWACDPARDSRKKEGDDSQP